MARQDQGDTTANQGREQIQRIEDATGPVRADDVPDPPRRDIGEQAGEGLRERRILRQLEAKRQSHPCQAMLAGSASGRCADPDQQADGEGIKE